VIVCGIAGTYLQADGMHATAVMGAALAHRGPDDLGQFDHTDDRISVHLAHRRLAIIDPSGGRQPMAKGKYVLSYNGELYNYRELRHQLRRRGATFAGSSDTEVVLEAWRQWGPSCLHRFRGMFAFALFDMERASLVLARDPLGIKPLYCWQREGGVVFASELKAILTAFGRELRVHPPALVSSIMDYWVPEGMSPIDGVEKVPPGSWREVDREGRCTTRRYFDAASAAAAASGSSGGARDHHHLALGEVLADSVAAHMVADVPVATFLSGGLDSSLLNVMANEVAPGTEAYTITFRTEDQRREAMPNDAVYSRRVAELLGIQLHEIEISPGLVDSLPEMAATLDEPIGDPAALNTLLMCQAAREAGVKVVLSGIGADELFGGYRRHMACVLAARYQHLPRTARRAAGAAAAKVPVAVGDHGLRYLRWGKRFLTFGDLPEEAAFRQSYSLYRPEELAAVISPDLHACVGQIWEHHVEIYRDNVLPDHVNRMCLADSRLFLPGLNLAYSDRASMAASVEIRVPFVDPEVFRAAFAIPGRDKIRWGKGKVALKEAAAAWLPGEIVDRPKASFSAPLRSWIGRDLCQVVDHVLVDGALAASGFLRRDALVRLVDADRSGREDRSKQLWQLLTLELWCQWVTATGVTL